MLTSIVLQTIPVLNDALFPSLVANERSVIISAYFHSHCLSTFCELCINYLKKNLLTIKNCFSYFIFILFVCLFIYLFLYFFGEG